MKTAQSAPGKRFEPRTYPMDSIEGVFGFASVDSIKAVEISRITFKNFSYDFGCQALIVTQQLDCIELG